MLPKSINHIGELAFSGCQSLEQIDLERKELYKISERAFSNCNSLKHITIPKNINRVESYAFAYCNELESIVVEADAVMAHDCFVDCPKIKVINITSNNKVMISNWGISAKKIVIEQ